MLCLLIATSLLYRAEPISRLVVVKFPQTDFVGTQAVTQIVEDLDPGFRFDEVIPSWNLPASGSSRIDIDLRAHVGDHLTKWYTLGQWSTLASRTSVKAQKDADGDVLTDTLRLSSPGEKLDVRVTVTPDPHAKLSLVTLCFSRPSSPASETPTATKAWGQNLEVPTKAQGDYPKGDLICSPTTLTMVLDYWATRTGRPELNVDVPATCDAVWDFAYDGAGNWPFNMAYAGSFDGMKAFVARFSSVTDLEPWIEAGIPVICSVASSMLEGKPLSPKEKGHLIVLTGFTPTGDPMFNNPAHRDQLKRTYRRSDFERAWDHSRRAVYLVFPESVKAPDVS